ncbi:hypothetical protein I6N95_01555 [Vagococcus sp. BWB3-3]|uniref:Sporulation protein Cse60 n=1 Tax=Vagococcus allomyrinae TaxID=2794353 RepID=A0A940P738_9ENTE|nr:hypothetical protein [Vagococcus allomyrinae]MBP1039684.1 hypothetical protein [Vagococcus allomyrinae]
MQKVTAITSSDYSLIVSELEGLVEKGGTIVDFSVTYDTKEEEYALFVVYTG